MTKSEEIETLKTIVKNLPKHSYLAELFKHIPSLSEMSAATYDLLQFQDQVKREAAQVNALLRQKAALADEISSLRCTEREVKARLEPLRNILNSLRL